MLVGEKPFQLRHRFLGGLVEAEPAGFLLVFLELVGPCLDRCVHGVVAQVEEERPAGLGFDEPDRFVGQRIGQVITVLARFHVRHVAP